MPRIKDVTPPEVQQIFTKQNLSMSPGDYNVFHDYKAILQAYASLKERTDKALADHADWLNKVATIITDLQDLKDKSGNNKKLIAAIDSSLDWAKERTEDYGKQVARLTKIKAAIDKK